MSQIPLLPADPTLSAQAQSLAERWQLPVNPDAATGLVLWLDDQGLHLKTLDDAKMGTVQVDFASDAMAWRRQHGGGFHLSLGIAGSGRKDRAPQRPRARVDHEATRRQVIGEGVVHEIAGADAGGEEGTRHVERLFMRQFGFEDWPG